MALHVRYACLTFLLNLCCSGAVLGASSGAAAFGEAVVAHDISKAVTELQGLKAEGQILWYLCDVQFDGKHGLYTHQITLYVLVLPIPCYANRCWSDASYGDQMPSVLTKFCTSCRQCLCFISGHH